jgi:peptidoglycan/LPS O-acetylase OafA/YrhL
MRVSRKQNSGLGGFGADAANGAGGATAVHHAKGPTCRVGRRGLMRADHWVDGSQVTGLRIFSGEDDSGTWSRVLAWVRRRAGRCLMAAVLVAYVGSFVVGPGSGYHAWRDGWLANVALALPALVCLASARRRGPGRARRVMLGLGMLCYAAGNVIYVSDIQFLAHPPFPSWSDAAFLAFYPFAFVALMLSRPRDARGVVVLDGALGAAAAAAALAAILSPVFAGVSGNGAAVFTAVAYPV